MARAASVTLDGAVWMQVTGMGTADRLERARQAHARRAWEDAYRSFSSADATSGLGGDDLDRLAEAAYMLGRDDDYLHALERAYHAHLEAGAVRRAVRSAFWSGLKLLLRGEAARANGWFGRAERLLDRDGADCVERGYLLIPAMLACVGRDDEAVCATAAEAAAIGERFGERDLVALVVEEQGHALVRLGRVEQGLRLIDETMVAVVAGELSPIVTGLVYCNTIAFCQDALELRRAREWTEALAGWCDRQPEMVAHTGVCLVHRAEILELAGDWEVALQEARRAGDRFGEVSVAAGHAVYRQGEVHRVRGEFAAAEEAYRDASRRGFEPQPGLALLRLAQGRGEAAASAIRRALSETADPLRRLRLLPAGVEILLAAGAGEEARTASGELERLAERHDSAMARALAAHAAGAVALGQGAAGAALQALRRACRAWQELGVPYEAARARVLVALACRSVGDEDSAQLELEAARDAFAGLGAGHDADRVDGLLRGAALHGLTPRQLEVLRLVAIGRSNREIAAELVISEHTVARHVQNILATLRLRSRTAASAFAFEHDLLRGRK